jgi:hypothetical protein
VGSDCPNLLPADPLTHERYSGAALAIRQGYHLSTTVECDDSIRRRQINAVGKDAVKWWGRKELDMWYVEMCRVCSVVHEHNGRAMVCQDVEGRLRKISLLNSEPITMSPTWPVSHETFAFGMLPSPPNYS